jgi:pyruvate/2-oxoglutarate/acetoin dehydrogenase E1 component
MRLEMSAYKDQLTAAMDLLAADPKVRFVGYGLLRGRAGGTLKNVPDKQILEMPTAENLMTGVAIGLSLRGLKPLLYFERADFMLNAADAIVNHLAAMKDLSDGEFNPTCIIRVTIGNSRKPLFTGPVHTQNFCAAFKAMLPREIAILKLGEDEGKREVIEEAYRCALAGLGRWHSTVIFEEKDLW